MTSAKKPTATALSREERLAASLRENLRRRKAQARALDSMPATSMPNRENQNGE